MEADVTLPRDISHYLYDHLVLGPCMSGVEALVLRLYLTDRVPQHIYDYFTSLGSDFSESRYLKVCTAEGLEFSYLGLQSVAYASRYDSGFMGLEALFTFEGFSLESNLESLDAPGFNFIRTDDSYFAFAKPHLFRGYKDGTIIDPGNPMFSYLCDWICHQFRFNQSSLSVENNYSMYFIGDPPVVYSDVKLRFFTMTLGIWHPVFNVSTSPVSDYSFIYDCPIACLEGLKSMLVGMLETVNTDQYKKLQASRT